MQQTGLCPLPPPPLQVHARAGHERSISRRAKVLERKAVVDIFFYLKYFSGKFRL
jgi:hypothetical protein